MEIESAPPPFKHGFPTRGNCDPTNPYEAFLWMLVALPNMPGGQLMVPVPCLQLISKRLWELGARPVEAPTKKYRPPKGRDSWWQGHPGYWIPVDAPESEQSA